MNIIGFVTKHKTYIGIAVLIIIQLIKYLYKRFNPYPYRLGDQEVVGLSENFDNCDNKNDEEVGDNLIQNGDFKYGEGVKQLISETGDNSIVIYANPSSSSYVLRQSGAKSIYKIGFKVAPGKMYKLSVMVNTTEGWNNGTINLFNVVLYNKSAKDIVLSNNGKLINTITIDGKKWSQYMYSVKTAGDSNGKADISFINNSSEGYRYLTNFSAKLVLEKSGNYPVTNGLKAYADAGNKSSFNGIGTAWKDLSGNGNDFHWQVKPTWNMDGSFHTSGKVLKGANTNKIGFTNRNNNNFTLMLRFANAELNNDSSNKNKKTSFATEDEDHDLVVSVKGNQNAALKIYFPKKYGFIKLVVADKAYRSDVNILPSDKNTYTFSYVGKTMNVYVNGVSVESKEIDNIYFSDDNVLINPNKTWDANLYSVAIYNRGLSKAEIQKVVDFNRNSGNAKCSNGGSVNDVSSIIFQDTIANNTDNRSDNYDNSGENSNSFFGSIESKIGNLISDVESEVAEKNKLGNKCRAEYQNKGCKQILRQSDGKTVCGFMNGGDLYQCDDGCCNEGGTAATDEDPSAYLRGNEYIIYIPKNCKWASKNGWGEKNYGTNIDTARGLYKRNFPGCRIPDILSKYTYSAPEKVKATCPFIVTENNPCNCFDCRAVDWTAKDFSKMGAKCKKRVNDYCEANHKVDPNCMCWKPEFRSLPQCVKFRREFSKDDTCTPDSFRIQDHPDYKNYVEKNKIPCWGCNL